jgi:hypothetical protein
MQLALFAVFLALYGLTADSECSWQLQPVTRATGIVEHRDADESTQWCKHCARLADGVPSADGIVAI